MNIISNKTNQKNKKPNSNVINADSLDITYICPRILAMSFPGDGDSTYINKIDDVAQYLQQRHHNDYQIYNLSGMQYDHTKFKGKIYTFPWEEKSTPNLGYLFMLCKHIDDFLSSKLSNVVAVHCINGIGRSGTAICCYLLYSGRFSNAEEALFYYDKQKHLNGGGITMPSQLRYVQYFEKILFQRNIHPPIKYLTSIVIHGIPDIQDKQCKPFLEIYTYEKSCKTLKYTDKLEYKDQKKAKDLMLKDIELIRINIGKPFLAIGDIMIKFNHNGHFEVEPMFRVSFNTAFIEDNKLSFRNEDLDPSKLQKDNRFPADLNIEIQFKEFCKCTNEIQFNQRCKSCQNLSKQLCPDWELIQNILNDYTKHSIEESQILLFGDAAFDNLNYVKYQTFQGGRVRSDIIKDIDDDF
ncbi:unnamed protein product [Paramecium pentaurelia]|uniref:Phosphatidylinositol-3,4,5-trisphosphate 3-phosphatase n=1 Tax=Paramecium pentaurelia TaxID=43138 RepID=A0A8S1RX79_9CILI|nr:unnamed protein product [Paramecium pentaurelia]